MTDLIQQRKIYVATLELRTQVCMIKENGDFDISWFCAKSGYFLVPSRDSGKSSHKRGFKYSCVPMISAINKRENTKKTMMIISLEKLLIRALAQEESRGGLYFSDECQLCMTREGAGR